MKTRQLVIGITGFVLLAIGGIFAVRHWHVRDRADAREEMLSLLPSDPSEVVFLDLEQFRKSSFLPQLLAWIPRESMEEDYAKFVQATGFNYERDLDRVAIASTGKGTTSTFLAIAEGRFDRKKMQEYARSYGQSIDLRGLRVFTVKLKNSTRPSFFTFLRDDRIGWTNDPSYAALFLQTPGFQGKQDWQEHFARLSGSAVFAVIREDTATAAAMEKQAPGGFQSPQLAILLSQLQWITIGGKPEENDLRVVIEGESATESVLNQLKEFLQGMLVMAQAGLNGAQNRKQMDGQLREAYLDLLKSAEVEKVDRGGGKSVRIVFAITPKFLASIKAASEAKPVTVH
jgi:hypothetical protein